MTQVEETPRRAAPTAAILVAVGVTIAAAVPLVRWADAEFLRVEPPPQRARRSHDVARPAWVFALEHPYRRMQFDSLWLTVAATLGAGVLLAISGRTRARRRLARPGTTGVFATLLVGSLLTAQTLLAPAPFVMTNGLCYAVFNALGLAIPGLVVGVWVVAWVRRRRGRPDLRERIAQVVTWIWLAQIGLLIGYGLIFG
ncbi:MAG: hypothetical protein ACYC61_14025 [Isosphaeraceae bacterium]